MHATHGLGHAHAFGRGAMDAKAAWKAQVAAGEQPSRGERLVAKLDQDGDGQLGMDELKDTRFGSRLSVDRFAKLDANQDGSLDAGEIDAGSRNRHSHAVESGVRMQLQDDATAQIIAALDTNQNGGLNSEEVAGSRLADLIGTGFGSIDGNQDGSLDAAELSSFLAEALTAPSASAGTDTTDETGEASAATDDAAPAEDTAAPATDPATAPAADPATDPAAEPVAAAEDPSAPVEASGDPAAAAADAATTAATAGADSTGSDRMAAITSSFEAALTLLQGDGPQPTAYEAVSSLYTEVQGIIAA